MADSNVNRINGANRSDSAPWMEQRRRFSRELNRTASLRRRRRLSECAAVFNAICAENELCSGSRALLLLLIAATPAGDVARIYDDELVQLMGADGSTESIESNKRKLRRWRKALIADQQASGVVLVSIQYGDRLHHNDGRQENIPTEYDLSNLWQLLQLALTNGPGTLASKPGSRSKQYREVVRKAFAYLEWKPPLHGRHAERAPLTEERRLEIEWTHLFNTASRILILEGGSTEDRRERLLRRLSQELTPFDDEPDPDWTSTHEEREEVDTAGALIWDDSYTEIPEPEYHENDEEGRTKCPPARPELLEDQLDKIQECTVVPKTDTFLSAPSDPKSDATNLLHCLSDAGSRTVELTALDPHGEKKRHIHEVGSRQVAGVFDYWNGISQGNHWSIIVRPKPVDMWLQCDDLTEERAEALAKLGNFCIETSPNSYQVWFKLAEKDRNKHAELRVRLQKGLGTDKSATGAMRLAGTLNWKYDPPPRVRLVYANAFRQVTAARLEEDGLLAPPEPPKPPVPQTHGAAVSPPRPGPPFPVGERHRSLFRAAAALRGKGADEPAILSFLHESNYLRCDPPIPDIDCQRIATRVVRKYKPNLEKSCPPE